jgi:hypothetical protein
MACRRRDTRPECERDAPKLPKVASTRRRATVMIVSADPLHTFIVTLRRTGGTRTRSLSRGVGLSSVTSVRHASSPRLQTAVRRCHRERHEKCRHRRRALLLPGSVRETRVEASLLHPRPQRWETPPRARLHEQQSSLCAHPFDTDGGAVVPKRLCMT